MSKGIKPDEVIENKVVSKKSGVFIVELIIAFIMFTLFLLSQNLTSRNYNNSIAKTTAKSHAISIAVNNINKTLATNYDDLYSSTTKQVMDGITYSVDVGVYKYSDSHPDKKDIISTVEVNVNYVVLGQAQTFKLSALKERK